jgi:hypothetical protein
MAFPYALYGGATRSDAISGLSPAFTQALLNLYAGAPPEVQRELGINSAYRSPEVQAKLFNASDRSGHSVAAPGKSRHNFGDAVDLYGFGLKGGGNVSDATKQWVRNNAGRFGLAFPMSYEPWHLQLAKGDAGSQEAPGNLSDVFAGAIGDTGGDTGDPVSGLVSSLAGGSIPGLAPGNVGMVAQSQGITPDIQPLPSAIPGMAPPTKRLGVPAGSLADLFKVRDIGLAGSVA